MKSIAFETFFEGAVSLEKSDGWTRPWRLPHAARPLFPSPDDALFSAAGKPSAVRLRFRTDSLAVNLIVLPIEPHGGERVESRFDITIENEIVATCEVAPGSQSAQFVDLPVGEKVVELWLPPGAAISVVDLLIDDNATCAPAPDTRKRWITYGSSLTHCVRANSAARVWPAIVARKCDLHVTSLGFGGQCHMDPMIGMTIRDLPADCISLKSGINIAGSGSLNIRTFAANMIGLIRIIREVHEKTPLALVTPFCCPPRETTPNAAGMTLEIMREQTLEVFNRLVAMGDDHIVLCDGLSIVDAESIARYSSDQCHHNGDGIEEIGESWVTEVMTKLETT